ncbi:MAG TPA: hypothetical protein VIS57_04950 [Xanthomonadales bacterium]
MNPIACGLLTEIPSPKSYGDTDGVGIHFDIPLEQWPRNPNLRDW